MFSRITKILGICDKEWERLLSMSGLFFFLMVGLAFGWCGRDAFFIKEAGPDKLPYMYLINSGLMVVTSVFYSRVVDKMARYRFFILQLVTSSTLLLVLRGFISSNYFWVPYAIFSLSEVITLVFFMHFWTFANDMFDLREGKRIFPLVGGAGLIGTVFGGALTKPLVSLIGTANLFVAWVIVLGVSIPITLWAQRTAIASGILAKGDTTSSSDEEAVGFLGGLSVIWSVPLIRTLTYLSIPMWLVVYIVDYQFFLAMDEVFPNQDALSGFLGVFNGVTSLSGLVLQLFVTSRLLRRFGVGNAVFAYPISMTFGSIALVARSLLPTAYPPKLLSYRALSGAFAKFSDNAIFHSINESASQLLYNALPAEKRGRCRAWISGIVEPVSTALAGVILILLGFIQTPIHIISLITFGLSIFWILLTLNVKSDYLRALVENLSSHDVELRILAINQLSQMKDANTTHILLEAVSSSNEDVACFALELLQEIRNDGFVEELCQILPDARPNVQIAILSALCERDAQNSVPAVLSLLQSPEPGLRAAAVKAIGRLDVKRSLNLLEASLEDENIDVRAEALIALIRGKVEGDVNKVAFDSLREMANDTEKSVQSKAAYVIGEVGAKHVPFLRPYLKDLAGSDEEQVQVEAIHAMGKMNDAQALPLLIKFLDVERLTSHAFDAMVNLGNVSVEPLHQALFSDDNDEKIKTNIIRCLGHIGEPASIPVLANLLESQPDSIRDTTIDALVMIQAKVASVRRSDACSSETDIKQFFDEAILNKLSRSLSTLTRQLQQTSDFILGYAQDAPSKKATLLLMDALNRVSQYREESALECLQLLTEPKTIRTVVSSLRSSQPRARAEAIELLEGSCDEARDLARVLETRYFPTQVGWTMPTPSVTPVEIFKELLIDEQQPWIRVCAIYAIGELKLSEFTSELSQLQNEKTPFIRHNVLLALQKIGSAGTPFCDYLKKEKDEVERMAVNMERILFLRSVPLFSDLDGSVLQWVNEIAKEKTYAAGETVFKENEEGDALYIIENGSVRVVKGIEKTTTLAILQAGDCFGEMAVLDSEPRSASIEVQRDATLLAINRDDFQRLLLAKPQMAFALFKTLSRRLRETNRKLLELAD